MRFLTHSLRPPIVTPRRALIVILSLFILLSLYYSVSVPIFEAPDEIAHFFVVREIVERGGLPVQGSDVPSATLWHQEGSQPPLYYLLGAVWSGWLDASDWRAATARNPYAVQGDPSALGNRNLFLHTDEFPWRGTALAVHWLRLLSLLCGAVSIVVTYRLARLLFPAQPLIAIGAVALHAFIPQFIFISAAVSNDALTAAVCGALVWQAARIAHGTKYHIGATTRRDDLLLGLLLGFAALAKLSGVALAPLA